VAATQLDSLEASGRAFPAEGALLRARIFLLKDAAKALTYVTERSATFKSKTHRAEAQLIAGTAFARLSDHASARSSFKNAAGLSSKSPPLLNEIHYQRAVSAWMERRLDAAERLVERASVEEAAEQLRVPWLVLEGAIAASRGDISKQGGLLLEALRVTRERANPDVWHWAFVVSQVSYLARELPSAALRQAAIEELPKVPWTDDIRDTHYTTVRAIGWCHALEGDYFNAFRYLKEASKIAPTAAWRVLSLCDRAYLAGCLGETRFCEQERNEALDLAATIDWQTLEGEERFALCLLAELFAPHDATLAMAQIAQYRKAGTRYAATLASASDRRVTAMEAYSLGVVRRTLGERAEAVRLFSEAYAIYADIGYQWRAGRAASALADLTGEEAWRQRSEIALKPYERSWLTRQTRVTESQPRVDASILSPARRLVYEQLVLGLSTRQIAVNLGRSEYTVRNHVKAIFKALKVKSRATLIARAQHR
jgi:DNA-binding NarL/FixJ family response regulator